jgi:hypothetical protein
MLERDIFHRLKEEAESRGVSVSALCREKIRLLYQPNFQPVRGGRS